mmetsp:Transcript_152640/g.266516  ORF Transcript_152640/g.266516 Transcript_152640/m.266516 type:complete len:103 (-) Transcript_152640:840-1148(-)
MSLQLKWRKRKYNPGMACMRACYRGPRLNMDTGNPSLRAPYPGQSAPSPSSSPSTVCGAPSTWCRSPSTLCTRTQERDGDGHGLTTTIALSRTVGSSGSRLS